VELVRAHRGRLELPAEHARRIAAALGGAAPPDPATAARVESLLAAEWERLGRRDGLFRVDAFAQGLRLRVEPQPSIPDETLAAGFAVALHGEARPALPAHKTPAHAAAIERALRAARERGLDELLWTGPTGGLLGATAASLFLFLEGALVTPSLPCGAFPGILRRAVLRAARDLGLPAREAEVAIAELARASDAFLASSSLGIVSIRSLDGRPLRAPQRGSPARAFVPRLRLRVHELAGARLLPP
jgi:branched-subunit amino acid aminotransferase/4-amino-4-deoxychorismate lyase